MDWILGCCSLIVLILLWITWEKAHRKLNNLPPGPVGLPIVGNLLEMTKDPHKRVAQLCKQYGGMVMLRFGVHNAFFLSDPALLKEFFITKGKLDTRNRLDVSYAFAGDDGRYGVEPTRGIIAAVGQRWKKSREIVHSATFTQDLLQNKAFNIIVEESNGLISHWLENKDQVHDVIQQLPQMTMNIISQNAFSSKMTSFASQTTKTMKELCGYLEKLVEVSISSDIQTYIPYLTCISPNQGCIKLSENKKKFNSITEKIYEEHLSTLDTSHPRDMIDRLIMVGVDKEDVLQIIIDVLVAGTHTSAMTLAWSIYIMATQPQIYKKLKDSLTRDVGAIKDITTENLASCAYLNAFLNEVQRNFPMVVFGLPHECTQDSTVGGYRMPKGSLVLPCVYGAHKSEKSWSEPDVFNPERWLDEHMKTDRSTMTYSFLPFGIGARRCVGEALARLEMQLFIALVCMNDLEFTLPPGFEVEEKLTLVLQPKEVLVTISKKQC